MEQDTQNLYSMHDHSIGPINNDNTLGTLLSIALFMISALFNVFDQLDVVLNIVAKFVAIIAGMSSILVAYRTYKNQDKS